MNYGYSIIIKAVKTGTGMKCRSHEHRIHLPGRNSGYTFVLPISRKALPTVSTVHLHSIPVRPTFKPVQNMGRRIHLKIIFNKHTSVLAPCSGLL